MLLRMLKKLRRCLARFIGALRRLFRGYTPGMDWSVLFVGKIDELLSLIYAKEGKPSNRLPTRPRDN